MRIAHVTSTFPPDKGGMGNAAYHMAIEAARLGHEVSVFTPRYREFAEESWNDIKVVRLRPLIKYGKAAFIPQLFFKLRDFDIIHLHYPFFGGAEAVWLLKKIKKDIRLIISYHMDVAGTGVKAAVFKAYTNLFLPGIISSADRIIVSSYDYADHSYIKGLADMERVVEIPYGVDKRFVPGEKERELLKRWGIAPDELVILFVGGMEYFKGVDCLIKCMPLLKGKVRLLIAGKGHLLNFYKALAIDLGLSDRVSFAGFIPDEELAKYYNLCDIFVLPSLDRSEAFGIVLIEAMACGKPVLSANLPGIRTVIDDERNGFLVAPGDVADMAKKLQLLIDREDLRKEFGKKGREKAMERYLWQDLGKRLNDVYLGVFNSKA